MNNFACCAHFKSGFILVTVVQTDSSFLIPQTQQLGQWLNLWKYNVVCTPVGFFSGKSPRAQCFDLLLKLDDIMWMKRVSSQLFFDQRRRHYFILDAQLPSQKDVSLLLHTAFMTVNEGFNVFWSGFRPHHSAEMLLLRCLMTST